MKIINLVLGLGTAVIVGSLLVLGIKAFYPEPVYPTYPNAAIAPSGPCASGDTVCQQQQLAYSLQQQQASAQYDQAQQNYQNEINVYDRNLFIIANVLGIIVFAIAFCLLFMTSITAQSVPIGIMIAGIWSIMYGYGRGWGSVDDKLKFVIGLIIAVLVIGGSMWLIERYAKKRDAGQ